MREIGYGSDEFLHACRIDAACRAVEGPGLPTVWRRMRAGSIGLAHYRRRLPLTEVHPTATPSGRMIGEHFSIRENGRRRFVRAQGVLELPDDPAEYLRGRSRQAVRTNVGHATKAGLRAVSCAIDNWAPGRDDSRSGLITPGPVERWMILDAADAIVAESILTVDKDVALLQGLVLITDAESPAKSYARWLLHTAMVERLCGFCQVLLTNSDDVYRLPAGHQHFQQLLGYGICRLRVSKRSLRWTIETNSEPAGLSWPPAPISWQAEQASLPSRA